MATKCYLKNPKVLVEVQDDGTAKINNIGGYPINGGNDNTIFTFYDSNEPITCFVNYLNETKENLETRKLLINLFKDVILNNKLTNIFVKVCDSGGAWKLMPLFYSYTACSENMDKTKPIDFGTAMFMFYDLESHKSGSIYVRTDENGYYVELDDIPS